jgi:Glycosyl transferase family 2
MNNSLPLSIVTTVFNGADFLEECIRSVLTQTFHDFEFIIVNDGSTDESAAIIRKLAEGDERIRFEDCARIGRIEALNIACRLARGRYIGILDADDVALPNRFERQMSYLQRHSDVALLGAGIQKISSDGRAFAEVMFPTSDVEINKALVDECCFAFSTIVVLRDALCEAGWHRPASHPTEDYDLYLRFLGRYKMANLPEVLVRYRVHPTQLSVTQVQAQVFAFLGAQVLARVKAGSGCEPTVAGDRFTQEFLVHYGVSSETIERRVSSSFHSQALNLWICGYHEASLASLEAALDWARSAAADRTTQATIHAALAARYFRQARIFKGMVAAWRMFHENPQEAKALFARGVSRVMRFSEG